MLDIINNSLWLGEQEVSLMAHLAKAPPTMPIQTTKNPVSNHFFRVLSLLDISVLALIAVPQVSDVIVNRLQRCTAGRGTL